MASKTVKTVDIQMLDENRENGTTVKLDNPIEDITREKISAAMQTAFTNSWLLCRNGSVAKYLGDTTLNTSIKVSLDGEDFYITPNALSINAPTSRGTITISGATCQGYNFVNINNTSGILVSYSAEIADNGSTVNVNVSFTGSKTGTSTFDLQLVIMGQIVTVSVTCTRN